MIVMPHTGLFLVEKCGKMRSQKGRPPAPGVEPGEGVMATSFTEVCALLMLLIAVAGLVHQLNQRK
jgi:hypothetical protein